jgi:ABC-2 type transport system permease protein
VRKEFVIATHEYRVNVRRKGFLFMTLLVPALGLLALVVSVLYGGQARAALESTFAGITAPVGVVDPSGRLGDLAGAEGERFRLLADEAQGRAALESQDVSAVLVVGADWMETGRVTVLTKGGGFAAAMLDDSGAVRRLLVSRLVDAVPDEQTRERIMTPFSPVFVDVDADPEAESGSEGLGAALNMLFPYILSMLLVTTIFVSSGYLLRSVAEEKTSRIIEIMLSSVTPRELLTGKVLGLGALGLTQVVVWMSSAIALALAAALLLSVVVPILARPEVFILSLVYYALGFLMYAVLMGSVGSLGSNMQESQQLAGIFSFIAAAPFFLSGFLFSNPNMTAARVMSWFPPTAPTMMLLRLGLGDVPAIDVVMSLVGLAVTIPVVLWIGAKVFRVGVLMTGKRPGASEVWRALRAA